jgi:transcriptional regulator with XRE-family HTH domain
MENPKKLINAFDKYVGKRLCFLRKSHNDSQQDLGVKCKLTCQQIQKYEAGANHLSYARAYQISKLYKVPVSYFAEGFDETATTEQYGNLPLLSPASMQTAKIYNEVSDPRVQKAILTVLNALAVRS